MVLKRPLARAEYENLLAECKRLRANYDALREDVHRQIRQIFGVMGVTAYAPTIRNGRQLRNVPVIWPE
jgi:hypothetical protein